MALHVEKPSGVNGSLPGPTGSLYVDDGGAGSPTIVFLHSFAGSSRDRLWQLEHMRLHRRAVAFDCRGHGHSDPPGRLDYSMQGFADDLGAVIEGLGLGRCILVGHSLGGAVAIKFAAANPDTVAGLVLVAAP